MSMLHGLKPKLRPNLRYTLQTFGDTDCCVLEDPVREQFWRIGLPEFEMISRLDGRHTVAEVVRQQSGGETHEPLDDREAETVISWLIREGLCENMSGKVTPPRGTAWVKGISAAAFYRLRLGNPQPLLRALCPWLGWLTSPHLLIVWIAISFATIARIVPHWDEFRAAGMNIVTPDLWLWFVAIWWGLKLVHELSHGLTCLRYGGNVSEAGILFLLFAPLGAYVDVTSSWRFPSKWQRIHVIAAGIIAELVIAAIAANVWLISSDPLTKQLCLQTILLASVATVLFNGNPLIRFDGYYLLADWLELPNLYQRGQLAVRGLFSRVFLGRNNSVAAHETHHRFLVLLYGMTSAVWRVFLGGAIVLGAATLFRGAGLLLAFSLVAVWFVLPLARVLFSVLKMLPKHPFRVLRAAVLASLSVAGIHAFIHRVDVPQAVIAPGIVRPTESSLVRAGAAGQIDSVHVVPGQSVRKGELLVRLDNRALELEVLRLRQELRRHEIRSRRLTHEEKVGELQAERAVRSEIEEQLRQKTEQAESLQVFAEHDGVVMDFDLDALPGRWVRRGETLMKISDLDSLEFRFSLEQSESERLQVAAETALPVRIYLPGRNVLDRDGSALTVLPSARWQLDAPSLGASQGGPIAVQEVVLDDRTLEVRALKPRISGTLPLAASDSLVPGAIGHVHLSLGKRSLATILHPWWDEVMQATAAKLHLAGIAHWLQR